MVVSSAGCRDALGVGTDRLFGASWWPAKRGTTRAVLTRARVTLDNVAQRAETRTHEYPKVSSERRDEGGVALAPPRRSPSSNRSCPPRSSLLLALAVAGASFSPGRGQGRGLRVQPEITRLPALCTCQWPPGGRQYHLPKCPARPRALKLRVAFLSHGAGLPVLIHSPCQWLIGALRLGRSRTFRDGGP